MSNENPGPRAVAWAALAVVICVLQLASQPIADYVGVFYSAWLVYLCKPESLPALMILTLRSSDFCNGFEGSSTFGGDGDSDMVLTRMVLTCFPCILVGISLLSSAGVVALRRFRLLYALWLVILPLALLSSWEGREAANMNWSRSIRFYLVIMAFPYGCMLAKSWPRTGAFFAWFIAFPAILLVGLFSVGQYACHFVFWAIALLLPAAIYALRTKRFILLVPILVVMASFALNYSYFGTFTILLTLALSGYFAAIVLPSAKLRSILFGKKAFAVIVCLMMCWIAFVITGDSGDGLISGEGSFMEQLMAKIFADRGPLWREAYMQINDGPYFVVPSGRPMFVKFGQLEREWGVGCHNAVLESYRVGGLIIGTIIIGLALLWLGHVFTGLRIKVSPEVGLVASTSLAVGFAGLLTGDFVLDQFVAFWVWGLAGLSWGLMQREALDQVNQVHRQGA